MKIPKEMHVTELGKMTETEVLAFQNALPEMVSKMREDGIEPINTSMTYKLSTFEDMARVPDGHQASLQKDIPLLAAAFKVAEREKTPGSNLSKTFPWVVFAPDLGDQVLFSTGARKAVATGAQMRQAAKSYDFVDDAIQRASRK